MWFFRSHDHTLLRLGALVVLFGVVLTGAFLLANEVSSSDQLQSLISTYGYLGVLILAIIAGLNAVVPIPAATFVPVFTEAGLNLPFIILALTLGTVIADFIGFAFGNVSREYVVEKYPKTVTHFERIYHKYNRWVLPLVMFYAAFVPFPNEAIIIPLALLGARFRLMLLPLLLGNLVNQTLLAYGFGSVFTLLFG